MTSIRTIILLAAPVLALGGCAYVPFMHPDRGYVVFFQPNSSAIDMPGRTVIEKAAHRVAYDPVARIAVVGAADTVGTTPDNIQLANARAAAVAAQLETDGVAAKRIAVDGLGPIGSPVASKQASRTATITITR